MAPSGNSSLCHTTLRYVIRLIGVLMVLSPLYVYRRFWPIYTTTECGETVATVDNRGLYIGVTCWNPNPYNIQILTSRRGRAYTGDIPDWSQARPFGDLEVLPGSHLPENGSGKVHIRIDTALQSLWQFLEERETPLFMELDFDVMVQVSIGPFSTTFTPAPFKKSCGLNILMGRPGPLLCEDTFAGMVPPHVALIDAQQEGVDKPLRFTADEVEKQIAATKEMLVGGTLFVLLPTCVLGLCLAGCLADWLLPQGSDLPAAARASDLSAVTGHEGYPVDIQPEKTLGLTGLFGFMAWAPAGEQKGAMPLAAFAPPVPHRVLSREGTTESKTSLLRPSERSISREGFAMIPAALRTFSRGSEVAGSPRLSARSQHSFSAHSQHSMPRSPQHVRLTEV